MTDFAADLLTQLPGPVAYGLGALALLVVGVALFVVLEGLHLVALGLYLADHSRRRHRPGTAVALFAVFGLAAWTSALQAQQAEQPVRTIEPRYTRIFSSDTMNIWFPTLSPNGRWVAFTRLGSSQDSHRSDIWVVSTSGGEPIRLTSGAHFDRSPAWFPTSDRIAFLSDWPSAPGQQQPFVMTLRIDPQTGQPLDPPRQVSLEGALEPTVSPDGTRIAYVNWRDTIHTVVVIPAVGGSAQRLGEFVDPLVGLYCLTWSADGEYLYFRRGQVGSRSRVIVRVPARGGRMEELGSVTSRVRAIAPTGRHLLRDVATGPSQANVFEVATAGGRAVARFTAPRYMNPSTFTSDGRGLIAALNNVVAPIRVVPLAGGPTRQLTEAREYDWPLGWSADARHVFIQTRMNGGDAVLSAPVDGGPATTLSLPVEARNPYGITRDGRFAVYEVAGPTGEARTLVVRRFSDGSTREVTRDLYHAYSGVSGPGGQSMRFDDSFYYFERRGERFELWEGSPESTPRLLTSLPLRYAGHTSFGVHQSRVAYTERRGDSTTVFLVEGPNSPPRRLFAWPGRLEDPAWSRSGRWLAFDHYAPGENPRHDVLVVGVGTNGAVSVPPRVLESGAQSGWSIQWLPNDEALTVFGMTGVGLETQVFLVSLRDGERPVAITRDDPSGRWGYQLSPDGRYVAYPAEIPRGSSIWRVDLGDVLAQAGREGSGRRQ